jgi:hypothetical protein
VHGCKTASPEETTTATTPKPVSLSYYAAPCGRGEPVEYPTTGAVELPSPDPKCSELGVKEGDACGEVDKKCVLKPPVEVEFPPGAGTKRTMRASYMVCRAKPFEVGPCPQSLASVKKDIQYLSDAERTRLAADVRDLRVVRYRYKSEADDATPTVGFLIDDAPDAPFVDRREGRVNLYSYASAIAVAVQEEQRSCAELRERVERLERAEKR